MLFLVTFFVYPTICAVSFQSFLCKTLKAGVSVLEADDNTFCEDDNHGLIQVLSTVVIIVFALGLPLTLLHVLTSKTRAYSKSSQAEDKELAAQVSLRRSWTLSMMCTKAEADRYPRSSTSRPAQPRWCCATWPSAKTLPS